MTYMVWLWLGAMVLFGLVEIATTALVSIWFVVGALVALVAAILGASLTVQLVLFALASALALVLSRPLVRRFVAKPPVPTNLDRVIGETAQVTETVDNERATGTVYVDGKTWTARSAGGEVIPAGERVLVKRMEGVKLFVEKVKETMEVM